MSDLRCPKCGGAPPEASAENTPAPAACPTCGDTIFLDPAGMARAARDPYVGQLLGGRFGLRAVIARGGMGVVYEAIQLPIGRRVAVKVLRRELFAAGGEAELLLDRFRREARIVSRLSHPNIVILHDFGDAQDGNLFMAFEYLEGPTLHELLRDGPLPPERAMRLAMQIAGGLEEAHRHGIVHRDLKPGNVMIVPDGEGGEVVKLVDFGIARLREVDGNDQRLTITGKMTGTPNYMSPEQIRGESVDARADVYSLGLMLHEMLTGRPAFTGRTPITIVIAQLNEPPPPLAEAMGGRPVPPGLEEVLDRAVRKNRGERFDRAADLRRALEIVVRRGELLALWSATGDDPSALFAAVRRHDEAIIDGIVDEIRNTIEIYKTQSRTQVRRRLAFFFQWCTQMTPSEDDLQKFLMAAQRTGELAEIGMAELITAFSLVFPVLRTVIERAEPEDRERVLRHWTTLERHFWLLLRITATHYEAMLITPNLDTWVDTSVPTVAAAKAAAGGASAGVAVHTRDTVAQHRLGSDEHGGDSAETGDFFENVLASMASGVLVVDQAQLTIRAANPALERLLELSARELVGRHVLDAFRALRGVDMAGMVGTLKERGKLPPTKVRLRLPSGRERWIQVRGGLYRDQEKRPRGVMLLVDDITEREFLVENFRRYVGPEIVEELLVTRRGVSLAGQQMEVTALFVGLMGPDGPGSMPDLELDARPEETIQLLNRYFTTVVEAVTEERGLVDTFVKDTVMALFGAPFRHEDDPLAAVRAAHRIREKVSEFNRELLAGGRAPLRIGAGIATGPALVGNVGSAERVNYTAVGDLVYRADRLRLRAAAGQILMDGATEAAVRGVVKCNSVIVAEGSAWQVLGVGPALG